MFGHDIMPWTRWDRQLQEDHSRPDFQPMELLVSGMYLGEIARFALIEAVETTDISRGIVPASLTATYLLRTDTLSMIERYIARLVLRGKVANNTSRPPSKPHPIHMTQQF